MVIGDGAAHHLVFTTPKHSQFIIGGQLTRMLNPNSVFARCGIILPKRVFPAIAFRSFKKALSAQTFHRRVVHSQHIGAGIGNLQIQIF